MNWIKSLIIAFSMYSKIPMPHLNLEEKDMRYVMGFFPLVGLVLGACQFIWYKLSAFLGVPNVSRALIFLVLPVIVTGGIHVDGYMDTSDAIHSYGDREKKLSILKDSHIGGICGYPPAGIQCGLFCGTFLDGRAGKRTGISAFCGHILFVTDTQRICGGQFPWCKKKRDAVYIYQCDGPLPCQCAVRHTVCHLPGWNGAG